jgi:hypothetical protein
MSATDSLAAASVEDDQATKLWAPTSEPQVLVLTPGLDRRLGSADWCCWQEDAFRRRAQILFSMLRSRAQSETDP